MENLSNGAVIGAYISGLVTLVGALWTIYKGSQSKLDESGKDLIAAKEYMIDYQKDLLASQKTDIDELRKNNYELATSILPALSMMNTMMQDIKVILEHNINERK